VDTNAVIPVFSRVKNLAVRILVNNPYGYFLRNFIFFYYICRTKIKYMTHRFLYSFLVLLFAQACSESGQDIIKIDPERTLQGSLSLNNLVESIEYIPLETNVNCMVGVIRQNQNIKVSNNYILVYCSTTRLCYLFSRTGKFVSKIGDKGNGPGEYLNASLFAIDEKNQQIILSTKVSRDEGQLMYYNFNGKFLHTISVDKRLCGPICTQFNNEFVTMHLNDPFNEGEPPFNYSFFSSDYELLSERIKNIDFVSTQRGVGTYPGDYWYYMYNGQLHVKNAILNDTVYRIIKEHIFVPKYIINTGKYSLSVQDLSDPELYMKEYNSRIFICSVFETHDYVLVSYIYNNEKFFQYYDKKEFCSMLFPKSSGIPADIYGVNIASGIPNDYDGGLDFWPKQQNENEFVTWYDASFFGGNNNNLTPKGPQRAVDQLKKVTSDLKEYKVNNKTEANPVIIIARLKK
jgi:hypothetical protein